MPPASLGLPLFFFATAVLDAGFRLQSVALSLLVEALLLRTKR